MSARYFCDGCDREMTGSFERRNRINGDRSVKVDGEMIHKRIGVEVTTALNGTWNDGDLCWACILRVVDHVAAGNPGPVELGRAS